MTGSCNCPVGLPLPRAPKNTFPFVGLGFEKPSIVTESLPRHAPPEERASYVDYAGPGLAWHWGGTCTSQCTRADVAQHALPWQTPHSHAHPGAHDEELSTPEVLVFHIHSGHIDIDQNRYIHQSLAPLRTINKRAESQKATVFLVSRFQASSSKLIGKPSI